MGEARRKAEAESTEMSGLIGAKSCRSCEWRVKMNGKLFCRRFPPQNVGGLVNGKGGQPGVVFMSSYPEVNPDLPCGEYKRSELHATEEIGAMMPGSATQ